MNKTVFLVALIASTAVGCAAKLPDGKMLQLPPGTGHIDRTASYVQVYKIEDLPIAEQLKLLKKTPGPVVYGKNNRTERDEAK